MPNKNGKPWTSYDNKRLLELKAKGLTAVEIGECLGRTGAAVYTHLNYMKSNPEKETAEPIETPALGPGGVIRWTLAEERHLLELVGEGLKQDEIAERLDRTPGAVKARLKNLREQYAPLFSQVDTGNVPAKTPAEIPVVSEGKDWNPREWFPGVLALIVGVISGAAVAGILN